VKRSNYIDRTVY